VHDELKNYNWIRNLKSVASETLLEEGVLLFTVLRDITLTNQRDQIIWRWTGSGHYSAASAYEIQFCGAMAPFPSEWVWKAKAEPKCKFFAWLVLHDKALTADNLHKKNWPHEPYCIPEIASHLLTQCNYTEAVWNQVVTLLQLQPAAVQCLGDGPLQCLLQFSTQGDAAMKNRLVGLLFTFWWEIWKERNRRIFQNKECSFRQLASLIADNYRQFVKSQHR